MSHHKKFNFWKFTWGISHANFPMRWLTNEIAHLSHIRLLTCEISHVTIHIWNFTCEISYVKFHMWNFTCEKSHVKFHMWNTCEKSHVKFHMGNTSTMHMCFTCEKSHVFLELHMWFTCVISVREATDFGASAENGLLKFTSSQTLGEEASKRIIRTG